MRHNLLIVGQALTLVLSILASTGHAQDKKGPEDKTPKVDKNVRAASGDKDYGVHKLTIQNGQTRTVHYFSSSSSPGEQTAVRELERAENETGYVGDLQALRRQYLNTERALESRRQQVQLALYGRSVETTTKATNKVEDKADNPFASQVPFPLTSGFNISSPGFFSGTPFATPTGAGRTLSGIIPSGIVGSTGGSAVPTLFGNPGVTGTTGFPGFGGFPGNFIYGGSLPGRQADASSTDSFTLETDTKVSRSLAHGIGDEGKFKTEMVAQMARQSSPEYAGSTARALNEAVSTVALITDKSPARKGVAFAAIPADSPKVIVTLESNEKLIGYLIREDANWVVVRTLSGESQVRPAKVARIDKLND